MFASYRVEDRKSDKAKRLGAWSYVWAGLFGAFYLLFRGGTNKLIPGLLLTVVCFGALIALPFFTARYVPASLQIVWLILMMPAVLVFHSVRMSALVRDSYKQRGWRVRQED